MEFEMKFRLRLIIFAAFFASATSAYGQKPCPNLTGEARNQCLQAEVDRGNKETARINKRLDRIDNAILATCAARLGVNWYVGGGLKLALAKYSIQSSIDRAFGISGACVGAAKRRGLIP
jgi:hypothetical protein